MTAKAFNGFLNKLKADAGLREELQALAEGQKGLRPDDMVNFANAKGYEFRVEEVEGELTERALERVAGGVLDPEAMLGLILDDYPVGIIAKKPAKK